MAEPNLMTPEFRVSYPYVFRPQQPMAGSDPGAKPKFSVTMLFPKGADLSKLKKAAEAAVMEKWGDKINDKTPVDPQNPATGTKGQQFLAKLRKPFRDQGEKESEGYMPGAVFITATSSQRPGLVDGANNDIIDETQFYAGCYARATVRVFTYDKKGNKGVAFGLQNIQKLRDGESLSGRMKAQDEFEPVADAEVSAGGDAGSLFG
jgi:hypothetical protein